MDTTSNINSPLFSVQAIFGKGRGLIALRDIRKGTQILSEKRLLTIPRNPLEATPEHIESIIAAELQTLSDQDRQAFISLRSKSPGQYPLNRRMDANAFTHADGSSSVYTTKCLINHSCLPNTWNSWNDTTKTGDIYATRFIKAGEEITIHCFENRFTQVFSTRTTELEKSFGFVCDCPRCTLSPQEIALSDTRRCRINLELGMVLPKLCLENCCEALRLMRKEFREDASSLIADVYENALTICIRYSDEARASVFGNRCHELRVICTGENSPYALYIQGLAERPADFQAFGMLDDWKTEVNDVPQELDSDDFEKWLWRN